MSLQEYTTYKILMQQEPIGYYELDTRSNDNCTHHYRISIYKKPNFIKIFFMKWILGFKYKEL